MSVHHFSMDGVTLTRGGRTIVSRVSMAAQPGDLIVLRGPSGSGKTTMLRAMAGLDAFDEGVIRVGDAQLEGGKAPSAATLHRLRRSVGFVFQFHCLFEHMTALQNVTLAPVHVYRHPARDAESRARELLAELGVEARASALPRQLSGGEAQRVAIARALAVDPPVLLMDEPTASLDQARRAELSVLLRSLVSRQRTLVIATHDEDFAHSVATRVMHVRDGQIVP